MSDAMEQRWWLLTRGVESKIMYLCNGFDSTEALKPFGGLLEGEKIFQLTWSDLVGLTGCLLPFGCERDSYAVGNLVFLLKDDVKVLVDAIVERG